jgi:hypothetical protein
VSETPLQDAVDKVRTDGEALDLLIEKSSKDLKATLEARKEIGKGWSTAGAVAWAKSTGWSAIAKLGWSPK